MRFLSRSRRAILLRATMPQALVGEEMFESVDQIRGMLSSDHRRCARNDDASRAAAGPDHTRELGIDPRDRIDEVTAVLAGHVVIDDDELERLAALDQRERSRRAL